MFLAGFGVCSNEFFCSVHPLESTLYQGKNHSFVCISAGKDVSFFFFSCLPEMFNDGGGSFLWFSMIPSLVSLETQIHYSCFSFPSVLVCSFMFYFVVMVTGSCI